MAKKKYVSGQTVVEADDLNKFFGDGTPGNPGHTHDGGTNFESASKISLVSHVKDQIGETFLANNAVTANKIQNAAIQRTKFGFDFWLTEIESFIFRPDGTARDNVYTDWASLYADVIAAEGARMIVFDNTVTGGVITIPAGTYNMEDVSWGMGGVLNVGKWGLQTDATIQVRIPDNCVIQNLYHIEDVTILNQNTVQAPLQYTSGDSEIFRTRGSFIGVDSGTPGAQHTIDVSNGTDLKIIAQGTQFSPNSIRSIRVASASSIQLEFYTSSIQDGGLTGPGTVTAVSLDTNSYMSIAPTDHPLFTGTLPVSTTLLSDSSYVKYTPALVGGLTATNVQDAIRELAGIATDVTLQEAYDAGNTIVTTVIDGYGVGSGPFDVSGPAAISLDSQANSNFTVSGATLTLGTTTSGDMTVSSAGSLNVSSADELVINSVAYYGVSAGNPTPAAGGFQDGDKYYDTTLGMEMVYDGSRLKWLSIESAIIPFSNSATVAAGVYFNTTDSQLMSATSGFPAFENGTVVSMAYTRTNTLATSFQVTASGTTIDSLATAATSGVDNSLDGDFSSGQVLGIRNDAAGDDTTDTLGWIKVKWRA